MRKQKASQFKRAPAVLVYPILCARPHMRIDLSASPRPHAHRMWEGDRPSPRKPSGPRAAAAAVGGPAAVIQSISTREAEAC
jgi:hypothetical protein